MRDSTFWLAINLYHEARGEPTEGQKAVCKVVLNRAKKRCLSVKDVVLQPMQFSWHNDNKFPPIKDYESFKKCFDIAFDSIVDHLEGNDLKGADHYFADYIVQPRWASNMTFICKIGAHLFYRE